MTWIALLVIVSVPVAAGWARWIRTKAQLSERSRLSMTALVLSSLSLLLAVGSTFYAYAVKAFEYFDPILLVIIRSGLGLSCLALVLSLMALRSPSGTRWHGLIASVGTLSIWLIAVTTE